MQNHWTPAEFQSLLASTQYVLSLGFFPLCSLIGNGFCDSVQSSEHRTLRHGYESRHEMWEMDTNDSANDTRTVYSVLLQSTIRQDVPWKRICNSIAKTLLSSPDVKHRLDDEHLVSHLVPIFQAYCKFFVHALLWKLCLSQNTETLLQGAESDVVDLTEEEEIACHGTEIHVAISPKGTIGLVETAGSKSLQAEHLLVSITISRFCTSLLYWFHSFANGLISLVILSSPFLTVPRVPNFSLVIFWKRSLPCKVRIEISACQACYTRTNSSRMCVVCKMILSVSYNASNKIVVAFYHKSRVLTAQAASAHVEAGTWGSIYHSTQLNNEA